jgi:hypothetical protein
MDMEGVYIRLSRVVLHSVAFFMTLQIVEENMVETTPRIKLSCPMELQWHWQLKPLPMTRHNHWGHMIWFPVFLRPWISTLHH